MNKVVEDDDGDYVRYSECKDELDKLQTKYQEIIYSVGQKHPNETRHETAVRYIRHKPCTLSLYL